MVKKLTVYQSVSDVFHLVTVGTWEGGGTLLNFLYKWYSARDNIFDPVGSGDVDKGSQTNLQTRKKGEIRI